MSSDSKYKLTYFNWTGLAEISRYMFALAGVEFEDDRIERDEHFPTLSPEWKEKLPWGQVPILEVDGKFKLSQSGAINRFLAKRFHMYGKDEFEAAKCDEVYEAFRDFIVEMRKYFMDPRREVLNAIVKDDVPKYFLKFDQLLKENGGKYFVGDSYTFADVTIFHLVNYFEGFCSLDLTSAYPNLGGAIMAFLNHPKIAQWIQKRPIPPDFSFDQYMEMLQKKKKEAENK